MARKPRIQKDITEFAVLCARTAENVHELRKAQAILLPALYDLNLVATGVAIGRSRASVCRLQAEFRADCSGTPIIPKKRGGRRRQNMSVKEEAQFLQPFFQQELEGKPIVVAKIHKAYESAIGKKVPASTIYRVLARHGWLPTTANRSPDHD